MSECPKNSPVDSALRVLLTGFGGWGVIVVRLDFVWLCFAMLQFNNKILFQPPSDRV